MARKKTELAEPTPVTTQEAPSPEPAPEMAPAQNGNGEKRKVAVRWKYPAAAGVTIEVALWPHTIKLTDGSEIEVHNATITRSYRDQQGEWKTGGSFRAAEIPVLIHALMRAHGFAMDSRELTCPL